MKEPRPTRLLESEGSVDPLLRDVLQAGRNEGPQPEQMARITAGLAAVVGPEALAQPTPSQPPVALAVPGAAKVEPLLKIGAVVLAVGAGVLGLHLALNRGTKTSAGERAAETAYAKVEKPSPAKSASERRGEVPARALPGAGEVASIADAPEPILPVEAQRPVKQAAKVKTARANKRAVTSTDVGETDSSGAQKDATATGAFDVNAELILLKRARAALETAPQRALSLSGEHQTRFPRGVLAQEREVIAIEALIRLGRHGRAERRAARFNQRFPASAHRRRLDALLNKQSNDKPRDIP